MVEERYYRLNVPFEQRIYNFYFEAKGDVVLIAEDKSSCLLEITEEAFIRETSDEAKKERAEKRRRNMPESPSCQTPKLKIPNSGKR